MATWQMCKDPCIVTFVLAVRDEASRFTNEEDMGFFEHCGYRRAIQFLRSTL
jgi:hypothetical protein